MRASSTSLALLILAAACVRATAPVVPPPAPQASPPAFTPEAPPLEHLTVCVVRDGVLTDVPVSYDPATGDSLYEGRRFSEAFPIDSTFAAGAGWFYEQPMIPLDRRQYVKYGLPRTLRPGDVVPRGEYRGVGVFMDPRHPEPFSILYLLVRPNCEFQPYETEMGGPVRGR